MLCLKHKIQDRLAMIFRASNAIRLDFGNEAETFVNSLTESKPSPPNLDPGPSVSAGQRARRTISFPVNFELYRVSVLLVR